MLACAVCNRPGAAIEAGASLCLSHLHDWLLSQEGKTAKRLYGSHSQEPIEKRALQAGALMKIFIARREEWKVVEVPEVLIPEPPTG